MPVHPTDQPKRVAFYSFDEGRSWPLREYAQRRGFAVGEGYIDQASAPARNGPTING